MDDLIIGLKARAYDTIIAIQQLQMNLNSITQELDKLEKEKSLQTETEK